MGATPDSPTTWTIEPEHTGYEYPGASRCHPKPEIDLEGNEVPFENGETTTPAGQGTQSMKPQRPSARGTAPSVCTTSSETDVPKSHILCAGCNDGHSEMKFYCKGCNYLYCRNCVSIETGLCRVCMGATPDYTTTRPIELGNTGCEDPSASRYSRSPE